MAKNNGRRKMTPYTQKLVGQIDLNARVEKIIAESRAQSAVTQPQPVPEKDTGLPKYFLTNEIISVDGHKLHRIQAARDIPEIGVQEGDLGGFVESERNLSHKGTCWVFAGQVYENAVVSGGATVRGEKVRIHDNAAITDGFTAYDNAHLYGNFRGSGCAKACDYASAGGNVIQKGSSYIGGSANLNDRTIVANEARICGNTISTGRTTFCGKFETFGGTYTNCTMGISTEDVGVSKEDFLQNDVR